MKKAILFIMLTMALTSCTKELNVPAMTINRVTASAAEGNTKERLAMSQRITIVDTTERMYVVVIPGKEGRWLIPKTKVIHGEEKIQDFLDRQL